MLILVVDDEPAIAEMIREILEREGHPCLTAGSVEDAEWIRRSAPVDVILLDLGLPGRDPLDWLEEIALAEPEVAGRTIVITGNRPDERTLLRIGGCGSGLLHKPFRIDALLRSIRDRASGGSEPRLRKREDRPDRSVR